ncbi:hypothetical protein RUM44_001217 [Polyplax serrata]|uniref:Uncharacterized protein n=1 Tax=Polyplax serrata TaxID=468196 RepID=A0ABR1B6U5_POLSC
MGIRTARRAGKVPEVTVSNFRAAILAAEHVKRSQKQCVVVVVVMRIEGKLNPENLHYLPDVAQHQRPFYEFKSKACANFNSNSKSFHRHGTPLPHGDASASKGTPCQVFL